VLAIAVHGTQAVVRELLDVYNRALAARQLEELHQVTTVYQDVPSLPVPSLPGNSEWEN
jgi:hypothetical protein